MSEDKKEKPELVYDKAEIEIDYSQLAAQGVNLTPIAEGASEFQHSPEDVMDAWLGDAPRTHIPKETIIYENGEKPFKAAIPGQPSQGEKDAMRKILEKSRNSNYENLVTKMHDSATYAVEKSFREPGIKTEITRAVLTEDNSGREWKVKVRETALAKTIYDVVNMKANKSFFRDIYLKDAANKLCNLLESNVPLNSSKISKILYFDGIYKNHYDEAMNFKRVFRSSQKKNNRKKASIYESRFEVARDKALSAKRQLKKL